MAADMLIPNAVSAEFFHTAAGTGFVDLLINGNRETWPIRSKRFRTWLRRRHYEATRTAASAAAINSALDLFEAQAQFDGPERVVHVRLAEHAGHIYLDLADECWRAVEMAPDGWRVIVSPPVRFRRAAGMLPLPVPQGGGSIEELASFLNLPSRNDFVLMVAWLLATLRAGGPYPVLAISGEQGSAKTVLSKLLKALIDPNVAPVRAAAREERDLVIAANNSHVLAFDNLSSLPHALSDAFCRLATGASFGLRQLYTDADEVLFQAARPILLNSIEDVIGRSDLADRALFLTLPPIAGRHRRSERQLWRDFENARPRILGALLDAAAHGLRNLPGIHLEQLPRMADFALWTTACETAFWPAGRFARAYQANRRGAIEELIDADPVAARVRGIMANRSTWTGSASDLLRADMDVAGHSLSSISAGWPKSPRALAGRLRRAQTFLRALGIEVAFSREGRAGSRVIRIRTSAEKTVSTVSSVRDNDQEPRSSQPPRRPVGAARDERHRPGAVAADDAAGLTQNPPFIG
jgi:hypothetical protein